MEYIVKVLSRLCFIATFTNTTNSSDSVFILELHCFEWTITDRKSDSTWRHHYGNASGGVAVKAPNNVISDGSHVYVENMAADYQQGDRSQ